MRDMSFWLFCLNGMYDEFVYCKKRKNELVLPVFLSLLVGPAEVQQYDLQRWPNLVLDVALDAK